MRKKLYKSKNDRKLAGVCGGIANYFDIDPTIIRVACVAYITLTAGIGILTYIVCIFIIPKEKENEITNF